MPSLHYSAPISARHFTEQKTPTCILGSHDGYWQIRRSVLIRGLRLHGILDIALRLHAAKEICSVDWGIMDTMPMVTMICAGVCVFVCVRTCMLKMWSVSESLQGFIIKEASLYHFKLVVAPVCLEQNNAGFCF